MPHIDVDFNDVPEVVKPITPGQYILEIADIPAIEPSSKGTGQNMIINFRIASDGEFKGRAIKEYIFLNEMGLTKIKNLLIGCGIKPEVKGLDTEQLLGARVNALVGANVFTSSTGEEVQGAKVTRYLKA